MPPRKKQQPEDTATPTPATGKRVPRSFYLNEDLLARARAAATYLGSYQPESGIASLSDIVEPGVQAEVERLERKYNNGKPFPSVARMPTGRPR